MHVNSTRPCIPVAKRLGTPDSIPLSFSFPHVRRQDNTNPAYLIENTEENIHK